MYHTTGLMQYLLCQPTEACVVVWAGNLQQAQTTQPFHGEVAGPVALICWFVLPCI